VTKGKRKKWRPHHAHAAGDGHAHDENPAARLTPLEETEAFRDSDQQTGSHAAVQDTIRVDRTTLKLPEKFIEDERGAAETFRLDGVVVAILAAALAFIAFIAWQITLMPEK
jgi:hypothetical protein